MKVSFTRSKPGEDIAVSFEQPADLVLRSITFDHHGSRVVLAIFERSPGASATVHERSFPITVTEAGEWHSITAVAIVGTRIAGQDRKRIRSGQLQG